MAQHIGLSLPCLSLPSQLSEGSSLCVLRAAMQQGTLHTNSTCCKTPLRGQGCWEGILSSLSWLLWSQHTCGLTVEGKAANTVGKQQTK